MLKPSSLKNETSFLFADPFSLNLSCGFSRRCHNNMSLCYGDTKDSLKSRSDFLLSLGVDYQDLVCTKQVHGSNIRYATQQDKGKGAVSFANALDDTDALVTDIRNLPLAIFSADCLVIFLYDSAKPAVGLVHAGWRGAKENIIGKALEVMKEKFGTKVSNVYAGFGPAIRNCCYEVSQEFSTVFPSFVIARESRFYLDLAGINKKQLLDSGVLEANIFDTGFCTSCHPEEFFSYRREGKASGRIISVAMLK